MKKKYIIDVKEISRNSSDVSEPLVSIIRALCFACLSVLPAYFLFSSIKRISVAYFSNAISKKEETVWNFISLNSYFQGFNTEYQQCK